MTSTQQSNLITLKGSAAIVSEFFYYGINTILYQRGLYPDEMFKQEKKYGLTTLVCTNKDVSNYLNNIVIPQLTEWLNKGVVRRVAVVIKEIATNETMERWQFNISCDSTTNDQSHHKDIKVINSEIRNVIRQITATMTFLPVLEAPCSFDLLFYTDKDLEAPKNWDNSSPCLITNGEQVQLRSFSTSVHQVDGAVSYKFSF